MARMAANWRFSVAKPFKRLSFLSLEVPRPSTMQAASSTMATRIILGAFAWARHPPVPYRLTLPMHRLVRHTPLPAPRTQHLLDNARTLVVVCMIFPREKPIRKVGGLPLILWVWHP